jgi:hypothetical protein
MKIYIAGKITDNPNYKEQFAEAEKNFVSQGHTVLNPSFLPFGFEQDEYMAICYSMIDVCEAVCFLSNWKGSKGANKEYDYAEEKGKKMFFQVSNKPTGELPPTIAVVTGLKKEPNKLRTLKELYAAFISGIPMKRRSWGGYWQYCRGVITIHCKDGTVLDLQATDDIAFTIANVLADDWEIATTENCEIDL